jgi:hypothetical protein
MAYTTIDDPSAHFQIATWTGDGETSRAITNDGLSDLQPDFLWVKNRGEAVSSSLYDSTRGVGNDKELMSDNGGAGNYLYEGQGNHDQYGYLSAIGSDGFTGSDGSGSPNYYFNNDTVAYVAWQWKANGGTRTTNAESGNDPGGGYQANTTAGFSIVDYTGTSATGTMAHGLGAVPHMMAFRNREIEGSWIIYHHKNTAAPETDILDWSNTAVSYDNVAYWNDTAPTSSVFTVNTSNDVNKDADGIIGYCWTSIQGYSKFGTYTGNGNANGPFVYTGFKPAWLLYKNISSVSNWVIRDNKRTTTGGPNPNGAVLLSNATNAESVNDSATVIDLLSNGFKIRNTENNDNTDDDVYVYAAFAHQPFVTSGGVPCTAH